MWPSSRGDGGLFLCKAGGVECTLNIAVKQVSSREGSSVFSLQRLDSNVVLWSRRESGMKMAAVAGRDRFVLFCYLYLRIHLLLSAPSPDSP